MLLCAAESMVTRCIVKDGMKAYENTIFAYATNSNLFEPCLTVLLTKGYLRIVVLWRDWDKNTVTVRRVLFREAMMAKPVSK